MNLAYSPPPDDVGPRLITVEEFDKMSELGIFAPEERLELVEGMILQMSAKGVPHEWLKTQLNRYFGRHTPDPVQFTQEAGWRVDRFTYLEPDFLFYPASLRIDQVPAAQSLLIIELSSSSLRYDLGRKASLYARLGVRDYWVIDADRRQTHVHRDPQPEGYGEIRIVPESETVVPLLIPALPVRVADMPA
ncbi:Uma2 family endonuclease [Rhizobium sp. CC-YZS058]|uniref:Uma2 family endonuclease n=1 Tax=Rhizobium sp. CC-YZS058 TaxID=3042153 RepID=UPI002B05EC5F|nr:Uma2 family endonuclease [Rhizobium sp. CC-YZS058]MEA3534243.1 Uma2 family endonuclease [Rhizobium sp. CC-YZS058]